MRSRPLEKLLATLAAALLSSAALATNSPGLGPTHLADDLWSSDQPAPNETVQAERPPPPPGAFRYVSLAPIYFDHNQYALSRDSRMALDAAVEYLKKNEDRIKRILIEGFTDSRAAMSYNDTLSERRTDRVRAYLLFHGINANLLVTVPNGERAPTDINWTPLGRARNRQVAIHAILW